MAQVIKWQMVVKYTNKTYSAVSLAQSKGQAMRECILQLQELIYHKVGILPEKESIIKHVERFVNI